MDDSTAVLRLPDFDVDFKPAIDSLVASNWARLLAVPYLVVDVRQNGGGCTCSYDAISPLLYTDPVQNAGADILASEGNTAWLRGWYNANEERLSEPDRAWYRVVLSQMDAHPNRLVTFFPDSVSRRDTVHPLPREVAVLVDSECASSCEEFVLEARQSHKVIVLGAEHTAGVGDYGNVHGVWLPGWRRVQVGSSRSHRLPEHPLDNVGIAPAVRIPKDVADPVAFARRYLRATGGRHE
jgi:C-terminal processing protease CtpA/Prc